MNSPNNFNPVFSRLAAIAALAFLYTTQVQAQGLPYGGAMPNVGAMSYDLVLSRGAGKMRMTGYASSRGGIVRWVHCIQPRSVPLRKCRLMINGKMSRNFALRPNVNLLQWLSVRFGLDAEQGPSHDGGPTGAMGTTGQWRWKGWNAKGRFRYWR